jgi:SWI/SNF-related matrix-associated actin-dependent regulator of chromatin subfamily A3
MQNQSGSFTVLLVSTLQCDSTRKLSHSVLETKIVGIQYYKGHASTGEVVLCRREPDNQVSANYLNIALQLFPKLSDGTSQYDPNAIRMDNVMYQQIGHLPRKVVEKVAPYLVRLPCRSRANSRINLQK